MVRIMLFLALMLVLTAFNSGCKSGSDASNDQASVSQQPPQTDKNQTPDSCSLESCEHLPSPTPTEPTYILSTLSAARSSHTATVLQDGRVLVVGGNTEPLQLSSEIYDPETDSWSLAAVPVYPERIAGRSVLLNDGRVLIAAGEVSCRTGQAYLNYQWVSCPQGRPIPVRDAEVYDPATNTFTVVGTSTRARSGASVTLLSDGRVLILGGSEFKFGEARMEAYRDGDIFDPVTNQYHQSWMEMLVPRWLHTATLDEYGNVTIVGGFGPSTTVYKQNETYSYPYEARKTYAINGLWTPRGYHNAARMPNGDLVIVGGNQLVNNKQAPTTAVDRFQMGGAMWGGYYSTSQPFIAGSFGFAQLPDSRLVIAGGALTPSIESSAINQISVLDPISRLFTALTPMYYSRAYFTLSTLHDGSLLAVGGITQWEGRGTTERIFVDPLLPLD